MSTGWQRRPIGMAGSLLFALSTGCSQPSPEPLTDFEPRTCLDSSLMGAGRPLFERDAHILADRRTLTRLAWLLDARSPDIPRERPASRALSALAYALVGATGSMAGIRD